MLKTSRKTATPNYVIPDEQMDRWRPICDTQGWRRRMGRVSSNKGVLLYPDLTSDDRRTLRAHEMLADKLSAIKVSIDSTGVLGPEAVPGDFHTLRTVAGYRMNPISVPPMSNEPIRRGLGLAEGFITERDARIFDELVKLMFSRAVPAKLPIRREASTGAPDFVNDIVKKHREIRHALINIDEYLDLVASGNLLDLFVEFNSPIVHTTGERNQADKFELRNGVLVSKDREINDELAARTSFEQGHRGPADKRVIIDGTHVEGHAATRRRTVFGTSFVPNYLCAALCASWRAVYLEDFEFTWKHREPAQILGKMKRYSHQVGFDVKQFDQTVPTFLINRMLTELEHYLDPRAVELIRLLFKAPYMVPYPWMAGSSDDKPFNPLFGDDPFDVASFTMELGLPSGIAINPDTGKLMMVFQYLVILDRYFGDVLEVGIDVILRGQHSRYAMLNMGDDCVLLAEDAGFAKWFEAGNFSVPMNYFFVEPERPISFLGNVPYRDDKGELQLAPNVISYLVNWLVPEHGIDSRTRQFFWAIGERERRVHYSIAPLYPLVKDTFEEVYRSVCGFSPSAVAEEAFQQQRRFTNLSTWDALILQNPDYLHYKVDESQITPEILDIIVTSLDADEVWTSTRHLFGRN